ncbi:MAG: hypothetical protein RQM90_14710 [Methanoculleus sp.]
MRRRIFSEGVIIDEIDISEVIFQMKDGDPIVLLTDGERVQAEFRGRGAYREMAGYWTRDGFRGAAFPW